MYSILFCLLFEFLEIRKKLLIKILGSLEPKFFENNLNKFI